MGDDAHQLPPLPQLAETVVHKHSVQLHPSGERQNLVRQSQRQRYLSIQPLAL